MSKMEYTLDVFGKNYKLNKKMLFLVLLILGLYYWCMFNGIWRFGEKYIHSGVGTIIAVLLIFSSTNINGSYLGLLPDNKYTTIALHTIGFLSCGYYFYTM